ncbi:MAG TPA: acyloxyacyl hydrolase [Azospirillum sp.]|nr:acyloxyacyl hydrolase [Azospirillum sp.]
MSRCRQTVAVLAAVAGLWLAGAAHAQDLPASGDLLRDWKLGSLDYSGNLQAADRLQDLHQQKFRIGGSLIPWLEPYATLKPWVGTVPMADGTVRGAGGVLVDVPLGSFVFTPSVGAGYFTPTPRDSNTAVQYRSQIELGYQFENQSRVTLGYSRTMSSGGNDSRPDSNIIGFTYRLPFGALLGQ